MEFILSMQINIEVSTSWHYWWKRPDKSITTAFACYCDAKHSGILQGSSYVHCYLFLGGCGQKWVQPFGSWNSCQKWIDEMSWFFACWYKYWVGILKNGGDLLDHETIKSGVSHKSFHESRRLTEWFLHADSDWIISVLTTNLLCIFKESLQRYS